LDEADKVVQTDWDAGWPLYKELRALTAESNCKVVLCGERTLQRALRDPISPLFNFANVIVLGPLDYRSVAELVTLPMKQLDIELENEQMFVKRIYEFTSGHPNVVQRLCHRLIARLNQQDSRRIALEDLNAVIEDPEFLRDDFLSTFWEDATLLERIVSLLMTEHKGVRSLTTLRQALIERCDLHPSAREVDEALQSLVDLRSILMRTSFGYDFAIKAFPRIVAGTVTLGDMIEILTEDYKEQIL
jgi:hypothetical protein